MPDVSPNVPIEKALQELLSTKHLYQSTRVDFEPAVSEQAQIDWATIKANTGKPLEIKRLKADRVGRLVNAGWVLDPEKLGLREHGSGRAVIGFLLLPIKTFAAIANLRNLSIS